MLVDSSEGGDSTGIDSAADGAEDGGVDAEGGTCSSGAPCSPYGPTPTCLDGSCVCARVGYLCSGNRVQTYCADNDYYAAPAPPCVNQTCISGTCQGVCTPGSTMCSGNGVQTCQAGGAWGAPLPCTNTACMGGACTGVCAPGQTGCADGGAETCTASGTWQVATPCDGGACDAGIVACASDAGPSD